MMQNVLPESPVLNWYSVIHKGIRTKDGEPLGYIASEDKEFLFILSSRSRVYKIPKSRVEVFDGSQVFLNLEYGETSRYLVD